MGEQTKKELRQLLIDEAWRTKKELRQLLIDEAWRKYMYNKAAKKLELKVIWEKDERKRYLEVQNEIKLKWKYETENRVNKWRSWILQKNKKKKILKVKFNEKEKNNLK